MFLKKQHAKYYLAGLVSFITFIVYLVSLRNEFVNWDDVEYIIKNPHIRSIDLNFTRWAFFDFYASNWHPLTWISHAFDYALWGLNPVGHHLTNNILHAVNTFLVVVLVVRLVEVAKPLTIHDSPFTFHSSPFTLVAAATTGLLFGLHPLHVESAAWVSERKDLLCALFFLLSIVAYVNAVKRMEHGAERKSLTLGALRYAVCFFVLALLSKPMAVSLPVVLLILDWYPFKRIISLKTLLSAFLEKAPFIALSFISSVITVFAQKGAMQVMESVPLTARCLVATHAIFGYLGKMFLLTTLLPIYPYPSLQEIFSPFMYISSVLIIVITVVIIGSAKKQKIWPAIWGYYLITLLPVLGIVQVGEQPMADRYAYLPSLGPFLIAGLGVAWSFQKVMVINKSAALFSLTSAVLLFIVTMSYVTVKQIGIWKNNIVLWNYVLERGMVRGPRAYAARAKVFTLMGRLDEAIESYTMAISLYPDYYDYINRGMVFYQKGLFDNAMEDFDSAISLFPRRGQAYTNKGRIYSQSGSFEKAIQQFDKAIELQPDYLCYFNRGLAYSRIGDNVRAIEDLNKAIELNNNDSAAFRTRGAIYRTSGRIELAVSDYEKACELGDDQGCDLLKLFKRDAE